MLFGNRVIVLVKKVALKSVQQPIRTFIRLLNQYLNLLKKYIKGLVFLLVLKLDHVELMGHLFRE